MEFSEEWKSLFPISSATQSPLLLTHSDSNSLGPLFFNPNPISLSLLYSSNSLFPPLHLPPHLLTNRFLSTSDPSILPSTASTVASLFHSPHQYNNNNNNTTNVSHFLHNRIQLIQYPDSPNTLVFFPTGSNDEKIGFFMLGIKDSVLLTRFDTKGDIFIASSGSMDRIVNFSANPVTHSEMEGGV
uniref:Uncharacterized protein LOC101491542 n=1 Tax=Cicer arietinum TaxID=3827 RepID=A0A1S2XVL6_CICAR|nr:uncharacterized protein LOC101491542 [Cicer arietinum]